MGKEEYMRGNHKRLDLTQVTEGVGVGWGLAWEYLPPPQTNWEINPWPPEAPVSRRLCAGVARSTHHTASPADMNDLKMLR